MGMAGECKPEHVVLRDGAELATALGGAGGRNGLVAVVDGDAETWLGQNRQLTADASALGVVSIGESVRSTTVEQPGGAAIPDVSGLSNASDIATLGRLVSEYVDAYSAQGSTPVVLFDATDELVDAVGLETTFRVLHLLSARVTAANGRLVTVLPDTMNRDDANTLAALAD